MAYPDYSLFRKKKEELLRADDWVSWKLSLYIVICSSLHKTPLYSQNLEYREYSLHDIRIGYNGNCALGLRNHIKWEGTLWIWLKASIKAMPIYFCSYLISLLIKLDYKIHDYRDLISLSPNLEINKKEWINICVDIRCVSMGISWMFQ